MVTVPAANELPELTVVTENAEKTPKPATLPNSASTSALKRIFRVVLAIRAVLSIRSGRHGAAVGGPQCCDRHVRTRLELGLQLRLGAADTKDMTLRARRTILAFLVFLGCSGVGATFAAFTDTTSTSGSAFSSAPTFLDYMQNIGNASCGATADTVTVPAAGVEA